jgi:hypothetical protein
MNRSLALASLSLALLAGCAPSPQSPRDVLHAYASAISEGRADDAYRLLSDDARKGTSLEAFRTMVQKNRNEALELGKSLSRPTEAPFVTAVVPLPSGEQVTLVLEDGLWRVDGDALDFYSHASPRQAIVGFARAFARERWDVLLAYSPESHRDGLTEARLREAWGKRAVGDGKLARPPEGAKIEDAISEIRRALPTATFEETGDRASMSYGGAGVVTFVREHGGWQVEDIR